uniref:Uncharacterized protein n=1 Tax=Arundo donax TaxID=35708 RepID=A0A0A9GTS6_ARUDO
MLWSCKLNKFLHRTHSLTAISLRYGMPNC